MSKFKKSSILVFIVAWFSTTAFCNDIDSLHVKLATAKGVQKVDLYIAMADLSQNVDEGFEFGYKALALSTELEYHTGIANSLRVINKFNLITKKYSETIKNAFRALHLKEEHHLATVSLGRIHHQLTNSLRLIGAYSDAIYHKKKQLHWKVAQKGGNSLNLYYLNSQLAELYYKTEGYDSALVYYKNGLEVSIGIKAWKYEGSSYNNIALSYQQLNRLDSAMFYFEKAQRCYSEKVPKKDENYSMLGIIEGNIGLILQNSDPGKAKYLLSDIRYNYLYEKGIHLVNAYLEFANYKIETAQYGVAKNYLDSANAIIVSKQFSNSTVLLRIYRLYALYHIHTYQPDKAEAFFTKYNHLYDSLFGENAVQKLINSRSTYELIKIENELTIERIQREKREVEILGLEKEKVISNLKITLLLGGALLIMAIAILLILKIRSDVKRVAQETALEKKLLEQELDYGSKLLTQSSLGLKRKKEFAKELTNRISRLEIINSSEKQALKLFISNELDIDDSMIEMEKFISQIGSDFFVRLKEVHPNLTENDIKLVVLIRMRLTIKQIAIVKGITPESVRIAKNRLGKKLKLNSGQFLFEYLTDI